MNGTCFQDPIGFIKFSISPEFVPLLMDKDLLHKIFVKTYLPTLKTHVVNLKRDVKDLSRDLQRLEVRGKLESKTLYCCLVPRRLSFDENERAKEGGKETTGFALGFACRLYPSHGPLRFITSHSFRARLCHAKNEAPEEEAVSIVWRVTRTPKS